MELKEETEAAAGSGKGYTEEWGSEQNLYLSNGKSYGFLSCGHGRHCATRELVSPPGTLQGGPYCF